MTRRHRSSDSGAGGDHEEAVPAAAPGKRTQVQRRYGESAGAAGERPGALPFMDVMSAGGDAVQRELSPDDRREARDHATDDLTLEQLAHRLAYIDGGAGGVHAALGPAGHRTPLGAGLERRGFDCDHAIFFQGASGLEYWGLRARPGSDVTSVIAFRGTQTEADRADDLNKQGAGMGQFVRNQGRIQQDLQKLSAGKGVIATGHSLGGSLAQIAACFYPEHIVQVVTFQAPGVSREVVARLRDNPGEVTARHHRVYGDVVDDAGVTHVPGEVHEWGTGGADEPRNALDAHLSFPMLSNAGDAREPWMTGGAYHGLTRHRDGSTADNTFGRPLTGSVERARSNLGGTAGVVGTGLGTLLLGPLGGLLGGAGGRAAAANARGNVGQDEIYGEIWVALLARAEAGDTPAAELERRFLDEPCRQRGIAHLIGDMRRNLHLVHPELAAPRTS